MLTAILILLGVVFGLMLITAIALILLYNNLVSQRTLVNEGWSGIDVQLRRRFNLVENLVTTVKGYASHETDVLEQITSLRTALHRDDPVERQRAEAQVSGVLANVLALAEDYPDLKADTNYLHLQTELSDIEDHIQKSRRYYNGCVRDYNTSCETFPAVLIAPGLGFNPAVFFELDHEAERDLPDVDFS